MQIERSSGNERRIPQEGQPFTDRAATQAALRREEQKVKVERTDPSQVPSMVGHYLNAKA